jgi:hypothetical protein
MWNQTRIEEAAPPRSCVCGLKNLDAQTSNSETLTAERVNDTFGNVVDSTGWRSLRPNGTADNPTTV